MLIPHDYHLHSNFSCDCKASMEEMCRSAVAKGIPEIGFTEHYDLHPNESCRDWLRFDEWWVELQRTRVAFAGRLTVRAGIEIGEPHLFQAEAAAALDRFPFDFALGSLHWVGAQMVFAPEFFRPSVDVSYRRYFTELERMTRLGGFDILSHFDVVVRLGYELHGDYDPRRYEDVIRPVLKNCVEHGIALDINTAAVRRRARLLTPGVEILRWFREMGGERITLGSDAHRPEHLGADLDVAIEAAKTAGLKYFTQFEQRQARLLPLP